MSKVVGFVLGGIVGAGLGLLFAPRAGADTRNMIADRLDETREQAQDLGSQVAEDFVEARDEVMDAVHDIADNAKSTAAGTGDELRAKVEAARERIAQQIAANAEVDAKENPTA